MKRVCIACALLIGLIGACVLSDRFIYRTATQISEHLYLAYDAVEQEDFSDAEQQMDKIHTHWTQRAQVLSSLARHDELDEIERLFQRATQAVQNQDTNTAKIELRELNMMILHLPQMESPNLSNIF